MEIEDVYIKVGKNNLSIVVIKEITSHSYNKGHRDLLEKLGIEPYEDDLVTTKEFFLNKMVARYTFATISNHVFCGDFALMIKEGVYIKMEVSDFTKFLLSVDDFSTQNNNIDIFFEQFMEKYGKENMALHSPSTSI